MHFPKIIYKTSPTLSLEIILNKVTFHDFDQIMSYRIVVVIVIVVLNVRYIGIFINPPIKLCKIGHTSFPFWNLTHIFLIFSY